MADGFSIEWKRDLRRKVSKAVHDAAVRGVTDAAETLLTEANHTVPHVLGTLERSGTVSVDDAKVAAAVSYDTPYAVRQHEDTGLRHPDPTQHRPPSDPKGRAKWLQLTLQENGARYRRHIADTVKAASAGGG
jgi:hypothetical protein